MHEINKCTGCQKKMPRVYTLGGLLIPFKPYHDTWYTNIGYQGMSWHFCMSLQYTLQPLQDLQQKPILIGLKYYSSYAFLI